MKTKTNKAPAVGTSTPAAVAAKGKALSVRSTTGYSFWRCGIAFGPTERVLDAGELERLGPAKVQRLQDEPYLFTKWVEDPG